MTKKAFRQSRPKMTKNDHLQIAQKRKKKCDGPTDGSTDTVTYRVACTRLEKREKAKKLRSREKITKVPFEFGKSALEPENHHPS